MFSKLLITSGFIAISGCYQFEKHILDTSQPPNILPDPQNMTFGEVSAFIDPCNFQLRQDKKFLKSKEPIEKLYSYFESKFFSDYKKDDCSKRNFRATDDLALIKYISLETKEVEIKELLHPDILQTDESYDLEILMDTQQITIKANQYVGLVRGLSTMTQLVKKSYSQKGFYQINQLPIVIHDAPRYPFRGFMLDTARHYMTMDHGAYSPDHVYTKENVKEIVEYALIVGLRVIPEFDNPGHSRSIGLDPSFRDMIRCFDQTNVYNTGVKGEAFQIEGDRSGALDPLMNKTYDFLRGVFTDLNNWFPDNLLMMGGDEVKLSCYNENPNVTDFMKEKNFTTLEQLFNYQLRQSREILREVNPDKVAMYWSNPNSLYFNQSENDVLLWWGDSNMTAFKEAYPKNKYVFYTKTSYYLDCGRGNKFGGDSWCGSYRHWMTVYEQEPTEIIQDDLLMGGAVAAWSELYDSSSLHAHMWPRAASLADRYWSKNQAVNLQKVGMRLNSFKDVITRLGIPSAPITSGYCEIGMQCLHRLPNTTMTEEVNTFEKMQSNVVLE
eukprot:403366601